ncbi:MAG TPA: hypothetical protein VM452_19070 [Caulifigura sp.]|nr:hypothetical protein [Caulifigura sp.]
MLTIDRHVAQADADWTAEVTLTKGAHVEVRQVTRAGNIVEYVYELPESEIAQVVLKRRRYRTERYEQVPVRNELLSR